ncbi:Retrovirus-related Pol polyprotein from transposon 297 [Eumeta japonica]|uniref:RNA-directed DNA polymerase n=1 Tax=Eumeta variegata TaxID=151549 RepID=A0A4C1SN68_EUMVA|nr:Retrovirus-related Pol polyprotein from transposon 297 [Eumeta japonica]
MAAEEFNLPKNARVRWKAAPLTGRKYEFIIGIDILTFLNAHINVEDRKIILNQKESTFINNPHNFGQIYALETTDFNLDRLKIDHLNEEEYTEVRKILNRFNKLFFKEGDKLTSTMNIHHEIRTTTDGQINSKLYRYPPQHEAEVRRQITEMEEQGIIRKSCSRYASPLIVVPKKIDNSGEKKYRLVVDYRKLNEITIDDKFPLPNIDSILDKLGRAQYFTTLDLAKGYHQILIREKDREKTAFVTPHGLYEFIRMPFGLKNAPATFQRLMNETLRDFINKTCVVYLDDILIFSTSLKEHVKAITDIFRVLEAANLKIQVDKCNFMKKETEFLGHILTKEGLKPNPNKIKVIQELELPRTEKQIKSFLGLTGYYRKFVKDYAKVAQPMTKYLRKGAKINTKDPTYIESFEKLKLLISSHPILKYPNFDKQFTLTTDASNYAIGAVLSQEGHPVCFASRTLNNHERNYSATDKEFLAILWSVNYLRPYLYGRRFKIFTDHQPIKFLHTNIEEKICRQDINDGC